MTEEQIERTVERRTDAADAALMAGRFTQVQYDARMKEIARWAEGAYMRAPRGA